MLGNGGIYAAKKRKKPVQKILKASPVDGIAKKTNPSKRHRDRLNGELDRLTSLLPFSQEVRGRLDKLSVLRLSVGYLKVKSFFHKTLHKSDWSAPSFTGNGRNGHTFSIDRVSFSEGDLLLQALNGFVLVVTTDGSIFYASPTVQDYLGFHQSDVVHQSVYELIHMDDRDIFRSQLHFALNPIQIHSEHGSDAIQSSTKHVSDTVNYMPQHIPPENSSFLERSFCCRFRCLLDNSSGFLALNFQGRLKYVHGQGRLGDDGTAVPSQLAMFAIATPLQLPAVMEIRTKTLIFQTKHRLDFAPMGIDTRGKVVLGYSETEITTRGSGYQFLHAADMMYCADNHLRMMKTGESGFTTFRLLTKTGVWVWVQANARLVFKAGRPDFIIARQKSLTNEEGEEHLRQRRMQLPFNFATGEGVLYESFPSLDTPVIPSPNPPGPRQSPDEKPLDPASLLGSLLSQDLSVYTQPQKASAYPQPLDQEPALDPQLSLERAFLDSHALLSVPGQIQVPQRRTSRGDPTAQAMLDSLGEILGEMGYGGMEGLEVEDKELRDWESALLRMNLEREEVTGELNGILANDVFSYVEEALLGDSNAGGRVIGLEQTGSQGVKPINSLSVHLPTNQNTLGGTCHSLPSTDHSQSTMLPCNQGHYGTNGTHKNNTQWQAVANMNSNLNSVGEQGLLGNVEEGRVVGGIQCLRCTPGVVIDPHKAVHRPTHKQPSAAPTQEGGTTSQGQCTQASSRYHHGNQIVPPTAHSIDQILPVLPDQPWIPSIQNTNHNHNLHSNFNNNLADAFNQSMQQCSLELNHCGTVPTDKQFSGHPYSSPPFQGLQPWQQTSWQLQQQLPHGAPGGVANGHQISEHHHTLTHTTQKPSPTGPRAHTLTHSPLTPSGSCMFERRGHAPASAPTRANGSIPVLTHSNESVSTPTFTKYTRTIPFTPASIPTPTPSQLNTAALPAWSGATYQGIKQLQTPFPSSHLVPYTPGSCSVPSEGTSAVGQGEPRGSHCPGAPTSGYVPENGSIQESHLYWNRQT